MLFLASSSPRMSAYPPPTFAIFPSRTATLASSSIFSVFFFSYSVARPEISDASRFFSSSSMPYCFSITPSLFPDFRTRNSFRSKSSRLTSSAPRSVSMDSLISSFFGLPQSIMLTIFSPSKKNSFAIPSGISPSMNDCHCDSSTSFSGLSFFMIARDSETDAPSLDQLRLTVYLSSLPLW